MSRLRKTLKVSRKTFFDPKAWLGWDFLKTETTQLVDSVKDNFEIPKSGENKVSTFEEAMIRQGVTEDDLKRTSRRYTSYTLIFLFLGFILFVWGFYLLFSHGILSGWILALAVCALFFSQAFRYDFWNLQIKKRRLDLTYEDWKRHYLGDNKGKKS